MLHFTRCDNLASICKNGLKSVEKLVVSRIDYSYNDSYRHDGCRDAICTSITNPNYKMFFPLRDENPMTDWAVIGIQPRVLWKKDCAFCYTNAATSEVSSIPIEERKGKEAFKNIFKNTNNLREDLKLKCNQPTNPQAEVLVFVEIELEYFIGIAFYDEKTLNKYRNQIPKDIICVVYRDLFYARSDWRYWKE